MIKRISLKKISICIISLISIFLFYLFPTNNKLRINKELEYKEDSKKSTIFLLDENNYLAKTSINIDDSNIKNKAKKLLTALISGEKYENIIPNGFKSIIPSDTKILNIYYKDNVIKVDFSSELLDVKKEYEEKVIEDIVYTLTSIENIKFVIIYINGKILTKLPKNNTTIPATLDRSFGINKQYDITNDKEINRTTIYYLNKHNDNYYYIPVTKINNDNKEKAEIIIEELSINRTYNTNLMSYLNTNTKVVSVNKNDNYMTIDFNNYIYSDETNKEVLDEVIKQVYMSISDNYDINKLIFTVNNEEMLK